MSKILLKIGVLFLIILCLPQTSFAQNQNIFGSKGKIAKVAEEEYGQTLEVEILSGKYKGEVVEIENSISGNPLETNVKENDSVLLYTEERNGEVYHFIQDFWHLDWLIFWGIFFLATVLIIGGRKGFKALFSLGLSLVLIFGILIPSIKFGYNPTIIAILTTLAVSGITLLTLTGFSRKTLTALTGTVGGILCSALFATVAGITTKLTGLGTEDSRLLAVNFPELNFKGILYAGIIIGALGAVMDTSISIASGLEEIKKHKPKIKSIELVKSGLNIGRDIMGSMLNTLIFAYVGASLTLILLLTGTPATLSEILNFGFITEEIIRSLAGSVGLLAAIPITAITSGFINKKN
jgi:uncharacterized membrane protein